MRNKTPLALMEQTIMVLVFALAAALCLWVFVWSDQASKAAVAKDQAAVAAQEAAEAIKSEGLESGANAQDVLKATAQALGGAYEPQEGLLVLGYSEGWEPVASESGSSFTLYGRPVASSVKGLGQVSVEVVNTSTQEPLFAIPVAWQTGVGQ